MANCYTALDLGVEVVPVLNKMDLPQRGPRQRAHRDRGRDRHRRHRCDPVLGEDRHGHRRDPRGRRRPHAARRAASPTAPLRAMIIDSWFDNYVGVVMLVRVVDGPLVEGRAHQDDGDGRACTTPSNVGVFTPKPTNRAARSRRARWASSSPASRSCRPPRWATPSRWNKAGTGGAAATATEALPGFKEIQPQVFAGLYPTEASEYDALRDALEKLKLNDSSLRYEPEVSPGAGLRLPLRLPRPAAHGDRAGAPGARVRPGPDHDRADRGVPGRAANDGEVIDGREPVQDARRRQDRRDPRADRHGAPVHAAGLRRRR